MLPRENCTSCDKLPEKDLESYETNKQGKEKKEKQHLQSTKLSPHIWIAFLLSLSVPALSALLQPCCVKVWAECACCYILRVLRANVPTQDIKSTGYRGGEAGRSRTRRRLKRCKVSLEGLQAPGVGCFFVTLGIWSVNSCQNHAISVTEAQGMP